MEEPTKEEENKDKELNTEDLEAIIAKKNLKVKLNTKGLLIKRTNLE